MTNLTDFVGTYKRTGAILEKDTTDNNNITLVITHRKKVTTNKPNEFLVYSVNGSPKEYFSSMYDTGNGKVFNCDHAGIRYRLSLSGSKCKMVLR